MEDIMPSYNNPDETIYDYWVDETTGEWKNG